MATIILDGRIVRDKIAQRLKAEISRSREKSRNSKPRLVIIQIGDLPESNTYISQKIKFGEKIGAVVNHQKLPENISEKNLFSAIHNLNSDSSVHGIIVQLPIPENLNKEEIIEAIDSKKDVDGQTSTNIKLLFEGSSSPVILGTSTARTPESDSGQDSGQARTSVARMTNFHGYLPATTKGILTLLDYYKIPISARKVTVVGRSSLVGKPTALAFLNRDATVTICHSETRNLKHETKNADILVVAAGKPNLITKDHVSKGQVIVDVGINVIENRLTTNDQRPTQKPESEVSGRKLVGDVDFENVSKIVKAITPVPGGVGPMTVASLFQNLLETHKRQT